jgi:AraC-like DNA-binding protein
MQLDQAPASSADGLIEGLAVLRTAERSQRTLVAESRISLGVRLAGSASVLRGDGWQPLPRFTLTGLHCGSRTVRTEAGGCLVLAHLHPAAAASLGCDARELAGTTLDLASRWPMQELQALADRLIGAPDDAARMALLEAHAAAHFAAGAAADTMAVAAVNLIRAAPAEVRIAALARQLGTSVDTLERRFTAAVGISPKRFARAARLRSAVLSYAADTTLTDVALGAGYYDQSHFVREMQAATGLAPKLLLPAWTFC